MEAVFLKILNMSITSAYVISAVILLRLALLKAPKKYSYFLWSVCAFRLCLPFSFGNIISLFNLRMFSAARNGSALEYIPSNIAMMANPSISIAPSGINSSLNSSLPAAIPEASANPMQIIIFIASVIWLLGISGFLLYGAASALLLQSRLKNSVRLRNNIYLSDKVRSPFVFGLFMPKIYLPFGLDGHSESYVLAHEKFHIKRLDHLVKPLAFLILAVHWFNPLCWIAFMLMSRDMEMSCDEAVLSRFSASANEYSTILLSFTAPKNMPSPCPLAFVETSIKRRIKNILNYKKPSRCINLLSAVVCTLMIAACAANPTAGNDSRTASQKLFESRIQYIGDNSGVGNIIGLTMQNGFSAAPSGVMSLQTSEKPYGVTVNLISSANADTALLENQAALMFALIENADTVTFNVSRTGAPNEIHYAKTYTRMELDKKFSMPLSDYSKSPESFFELCSIIDYIGQIPMPERGTAQYSLNNTKYGSLLVSVTDISQSDSAEYIEKLKADGFSETASASESVSSGILLKKGNSNVSIAYSGNIMKIMISKHDFTL